jgi:hypothetical protein
VGNQSSIDRQPGNFPESLDNCSIVFAMIRHAGR